LAADCSDICEVEDLGTVFKNQRPEFWSRVEEMDIALVLFARDSASKRKTDPMLYIEKKKKNEGYFMFSTLNYVVLYTTEVKVRA
jgi:hypothetical protein